MTRAIHSGGQWRSGGDPQKQVQHTLPYARHRLVVLDVVFLRPFRDVTHVDPIIRGRGSEAFELRLGCPLRFFGDAAERGRHLFERPGPETLDHANVDSRK